MKSHHKNSNNGIPSVSHKLNILYIQFQPVLSNNQLVPLIKLIDTFIALLIERNDNNNSFECRVQQFVMHD